MADFGGDAEAFRVEARDWLEANFPPSLKGVELAMTVEEPTGDAKLWKERMGAKGWGTPTWPNEYGGGGLTSAEARVLQQEMNRIGAWNPIGGMGVMMFGPTLLEYGNEEQKQRHIPPIVHGRDALVPGLSPSRAPAPTSPRCRPRPRTRATTTWSTARRSGPRGAQCADWCFCLVRTDTNQEARRHQLPADRHEDAGRRGAADQADLAAPRPSARPSSPT